MKRFIFVQLREFITYGSIIPFEKKKKEKIISALTCDSPQYLKQTTAMIYHVPIRWSIHLLSKCKSANACYWFYLTICAKRQYGDIKTTVVSFTSSPWIAHASRFTRHIVMDHKRNLRPFIIGPTEIDQPKIFVL